MTTSSESGKDHERQPQHKIPAPEQRSKHAHQPWPCQPGVGRSGGGGGRQAYTVHIAKGNKRHHKPGK